MARRTSATSRTARARRSPRAPATVTSPALAPRTAEVVLDLEVERGAVHLVLANCGDAVATAIRVEFSRPLKGVGGTIDISALPVFHSLGVLRPARTLRLFWDAAHTLLAREGDAEPFVATVSWDEPARERQRAQYRHDPSIYRQWPERVERD